MVVVVAEGGGEEKGKKKTLPGGPAGSPRGARR
jgi:hypothetical protein